MIYCPHHFVYAALAGLYAASSIGLDKTLTASLLAACYALLALSRGG